MGKYEGFKNNNDNSNKYNIIAFFCVSREPYKIQLFRVKRSDNMYRDNIWNI